MGRFTLGACGAIALIALSPQSAFAAGGGAQDSSVRWTIAVLPLLAGFCIILALTRRWGIAPLTISLGLSVLLGPTVLGRIPGCDLSESFRDPVVRGANKLISDLGVLALIFWAGLHLNLNEVRRRKVIAGSIGMGGGLLVFAVGFGLGYVFLGFHQPETEHRVASAMLIGVLGMVAAVVTSVKVLDDVDLLKSRLGDTHFAICGVNELVAWSLLSLTFTVASPSNTSISGLIGPPLFSVIVTIVILASRNCVGRRILPTIFGPHPSAQEVIPAAFLILLAFAALFSVCGTGLLYGAFLAGVLLGRWEALNGKKQNSLLNFLKHVAVPIYFFTIGMSHDFAKHFTFSMFALILGLVALRGAVTGILAWLIGASPWESRGLATMQLLGGAIELAIVKLGVDRGIASEELLTAVALHVMISVAGVPWLLKRLKGETPQVLSLLEAASPFVGRVKPTGRRITPQKLLSRVIGKWAKTPAVRAECLTSEHLLHLLRGKERHGGVIGKTALRFAFAKGLKSPLLSAISFPSEVTWGDRHQKIELLLIIIWPQPETTRLEYATYAEIEDAVQILDDRYRSEFIGLLSPSTNDSSTEFEVPPGMLNDSAVSPALGKETLPKVNYEAALRLLCHGRELSHED